MFQPSSANTHNHTSMYQPQWYPAPSLEEEQYLVEGGTAAAQTQLQFGDAPFNLNSFVVPPDVAPLKFNDFTMVPHATLSTTAPATHYLDVADSLQGGSTYGTIARPVYAPAAPTQVYNPYTTSGLAPAPAHPSMQATEHRVPVSGPSLAVSTIHASTSGPSYAHGRQDLWHANLPLPVAHATNPLHPPQSQLPSYSGWHSSLPDHGHTMAYETAASTSRWSEPGISEQDSAWAAFGFQKLCELGLHPEQTSLAQPQWGLPDVGDAGWETGEPPVTEKSKKPEKQPRKKGKRAITGVLKDAGHKVACKDRLPSGLHQTQTYISAGRSRGEDTRDPVRSKIPCRASAETSDVQESLDAVMQELGHLLEGIPLPESAEAAWDAAALGMGTPKTMARLS
ncbi:hypothetical protein BC834DRAFT_1044790 [Gloeopeniophorella convolvens]|nr:hypothetical protein BC834DRAFT_1044790 [Gloeopeniophorella convolvens]